jgi:hypothetical protein
MAELAATLAQWASQRPLSLPERLELHQRLNGRFSVIAAVQKVFTLYRQLPGSSR